MSEKPETQSKPCSLAIELGDLTFNARGGKFFPLRGQGSSPPVWTSSDWQKIIWHPSAFNDPEARRVDLCLELDEGTKSQLQEVERHLARSVSDLTTTDGRIFGKSLTQSEVLERLQSCIKANSRGGSFLRVKMDWQRVRIWGALGEVVKDPGNLAGRECKVKCELRQLWLMTNACGVLFEVTDLMLKEPVALMCPF